MNYRWIDKNFLTVGIICEPSVKLVITKFIYGRSVTILTNHLPFIKLMKKKSDISL